MMCECVRVFVCMGVDVCTDVFLLRRLRGERFTLENSRGKGRVDMEHSEILKYMNIIY